MLDALASEHGLPILRFLQGREWTLASEVAQGLRVHTSTASKYLVAFHEAGFLDRKAHASRKPTHAYRLRSPIIRIEFDLAERVPPKEAREFAFAFADSLLEAAQRVGGTRLMASLAREAWGEENWRPRLEQEFARGQRARAVVESILENARRACSRLLGAAAGGRLVRIAWSTAIAGRSDLVASLDLAEVTA